MWIHLLSLGLIDGGGSGVVEKPKVAGGYDDDEKSSKPKKRFVVEKDGKFLVFNTAQQALDAQPKKKKVEPIEIAAEIAEEVKELSLPLVREYAQVSGQIEQYNTAYNSQHFGALIALFTRLQAQIQDDEDVELLLLA